jgi:hypothetical protein
MSDVKLLNPNIISFHQVAHPESRATQVEIEKWWATFHANHPSLFNGTLIACCNYRFISTGQLEIDWYKTNYAHYLLRIDSKISTKAARAIYCSVALVSTAGRVIVAQMSKETSAPNRLQLPGGNIEVSNDMMLTLENCINDADIGLIFTNRLRIQEEFVNNFFSNHIGALYEQNIKPEICKIHFLSGFSSNIQEENTWVDYLPMVVQELTKDLNQRGA